MAGIFICVLMVLMFYFTRGEFLQSLLSGLSAAMAILPEEFPVVLTVFLALGSWRLSKKNVLTRKPSAIETLGSATVLCSDKTGTITQNKMELSAIYNGTELIDKKEFDEKIKEISVCAHLASRPQSADPMEKAISDVGEIFHDTESNYSFVQEFPLSNKLKAMSCVFKSADSSLKIFTKGAPEDVFKLCQLSNDDQQKYHTAINDMAARGLRVLAVAKAEYKETALPKNQEEFKLTLIGLIGLEDPIRPEVPNAIKECYDAGIKVIMITGDFPLTAKAIATKAGLKESGRVVTGDEINNWSDEELQQKINSINVFARVVPEQKLRIIKALKNNNEVVAMTGDGVNDAPALKAADIGVAMGKKGTDVAREASSLVLLDDNFASIVMAIRLGRKIYDNLQKAMSYIMAIHVPIIGLTLLPAFFSNMPLLLLPLHIIFMELIVDPICSIAFESEQEEKSIMQRNPRPIDERFFGFKKVIGSAINGTLLFIMVLVVFYLSLKEGHDEKEARAISFSALIIGN
ncbi:MAG TPA: HAD-IC family P-type ATPase, partial [Bacteroidia bacterium]|nr:HAD-IC family P-type ATPase [Bacteroidia bacterium]